MLMNDMGDDGREQQQTRIWRNAASLAGFLSITMTINVALTTVLPGISIAMRAVSGVLAVVCAARLPATEQHEGRQNIRIVRPNPDWY